MTIMHKIAGLMTVKDYKEDCLAFQSLRSLTDLTIVLDDNSNLPFPYRNICDEYLTLRHNIKWHDVGNRTLLMHRAFIHGCDWVVWSDDDILFSHNFQNRKDVERAIAVLETANKDTGRFILHDLWDSIRQYRKDGIWANKTFVVLRKNWFQCGAVRLPSPCIRLHTPVYPINRTEQVLVLQDYIAYHTGCLTVADREERVQKYAKEDPNMQFQEDYSYMLRTEQLELANVPEVDLSCVESKHLSNRMLP